MIDLTLKIGCEELTTPPHRRQVCRPTTSFQARRSSRQLLTGFSRASSFLLLRSLGQGKSPSPFHRVRGKALRTGREKAHLKGGLGVALQHGLAARSTPSMHDPPSAMMPLFREARTSPKIQLKPEVLAYTIFIIHFKRFMERVYSHATLNKSNPVCSQKLSVGPG